MCFINKGGKISNYITSTCATTIMKIIVSEPLSVPVIVWSVDNIYLTRKLIGLYLLWHYG